MHRVRAAVVAFALAAIALAATPTPALAAAPLPQDGSILFLGHGWGHGRGMGQYGAKGQAQQGKTYEQILRSYYSSVSLANRAAEWIRVHLEDSSDTVVTSDAAFTAAWSGGSQIARTDATYKILRARYTSSATIVEKAASISGPWAHVASGNAAVRFAPTSSLLQLVFNSGVVRYYRGMLEARRSASSLWSINDLNMEHYLYGSVPREMPASWPAHAVRAQAVAARSYAAYKKDSARAARKVVDICATTSCQVYLGYGYKTGMNGTVTVAEASAANAAVDATRGKILTYNGRPILAEYSSSTGGYTSAGNVAYLSPRPDPADSVSPHHLWRARVRVRDIETRYPAIGRLTDLRVTSRAGHGEWGGRVKEMVIDGTSGGVTVTGGAFRTAFGWPQRSEGLKSSWFLPRIYRAELVSNGPAVTLLSGSTARAEVRIRNTGTAAWPVNGYVYLATTNPSWRASRFAGSEWPSRSRSAAVTRNVTRPSSAWIGPGETAEFRFLVHAAGVRPGVYEETFRPYVADFTWMNDPGINVRVVVKPSFLDEIGNLVTNGSFEDGMTAWRGHGSFNSGDGIASDVVRIDARSLTLAGGANRAAVQRIELSGKAGRRIHVSGWNRSSDTNGSGGPIGLLVGFRNTDGSTTWSRLDFPRQPHTWVYREATATAAKPFHEIAFYAVMHGQNGRAWFDGLRLADSGAANPSFETGVLAPWQPTGFASGDVITGGAFRDGLRSLHIGGASNTKRLKQTFTASGAAGKTMTLSAWTKTSGTNPQGGQIAVAMAYLNNDGSRSPATLYFNKATHDWTAMHRTAIAPKPFRAIEVQVGVSAQSGHVWVDSILLRENSLANPSFEASTASWNAYGTYGASDGVTSALQRDGRRALHLTGDGTNKGLRQRLNRSGRAGTTFVLGGWSTSSGTSSSGGIVAFIIGIRHTDGSTTWTEVEFARTEHDWTYTEQRIAAGKAFNAIDVYAVLYGQRGHAWFDGVGLRPA